MKEGSSEITMKFQVKENHRYSRQGGIVERINAQLEKRGISCLDRNLPLEEVLETFEKALIYSSKQDKILEDVCKVLSLKTSDGCVAAVKTLEAVTRTLPKIQNFVKDLCGLVFSNNERKIEHVLPTLELHYKQLENLKQFKSKVQQKLNMKTGCSVEDILAGIDKSNEVVEHFCRLFEVKKECARESIGDLFIFVYELESFLKQCKQALAIPRNTSTSSTITVIKKKLNL